MQRKMGLDTRRYLVACLASGLIPFIPGVATADTVTVASSGGAYQDALREAVLKPAMERLGITIKEETISGIAEIRAQVESGAVAIDLIEWSADVCVVGENQNLWEKLDYSQIPNAEGLDPALVHEYWLGAPVYYSVVLAWRTGKYKDNPPKSWKDFWDVEEFPGARTLYNNPFSTLEVALLADGVSREDLYPLDLDRAFAKLRELKPNIVSWWTSGAQSAQLLSSGEADMAMIWNGRASTVMREGAEIDFTFNDGLLGLECVAILRGSSNAELAMKVVNEFADPELQANYPKYIDYGPVNPKAFETGQIPRETWLRVNSAPDNLRVQTLLNDQWWGDKREEIQVRWDEFIQE